MRIALLIAAVGSLCGQSVLLLSPGSVKAGNSVALDLTISSAPGSEPAAAQWTLAYPASKFNAVTTVPGAASLAAGKGIDCSSASGQYLCLITGLNQNQIPNGVAARITLTATTDQPRSTQELSVTGTVAASAVADPIVLNGSVATVRIRK